MMFWIIAGLMTVGAMLFVVLPLLSRSNKVQAQATRSELNLSVYRDQMRELDADLADGSLDKEQYQSARSELEGRVLEDYVPTDKAVAASSDGRRWIIAAAVAIPVLTVLLYLMLGKPEGLEAQHKTMEADQPQAITQEQINAMVASLAKKLEANPNDAEGWMMLGRSYATMRRYGEASAAYARAAALLPNNAQLLADYADVLAMNNGRNLQGEPEKAIKQALQADPNNIKALALAGSAAFQRKDYRGAIERWQKLLKLVPPDSPIARSISANISQAQGFSGQPLTQRK